MGQSVQTVWELLRGALELELSGNVGRINLAFGIVAAVLVTLFLAKKWVEAIGILVLRLFGRRGGPKGERDNLIAVLSLLVYFILSLGLVGFFDSRAR